MRFNSKKWVRQIIDSEKLAGMPIMTYPALQITGRKVIDLVTNGEEQAKCIEILAKRFPSAAGVMAMDLSVEAEAFGSTIIFSNDEIPTISQRLVYDGESIEKLAVPEFGAARTDEFVKAAALASRAIADRPVFGGVIGPFSLAGRLFDMTEMMTNILIDPDSSHVLLEKCTTFLINYAAGYKKAGVAGLIIAEPAAGLLAPEECHNFSSGYVKRIVDAVQDEEFMVILHNCGNTVPLVQSMLSVGAMGYHFGNAVGMKEILEQIPDNILVSGNLDPAGVLRMCSADDVRLRTLKMLDDCKAHKNYVPSSGCDIPPGTPLENIDAFFSALNEFNAGK
jgi:uroporphyrinogen decarboxylase